MSLGENGNVNRACIDPKQAKREDGTMAKLTTAKGKTRGKNPRDIEYLQFNRETPEDLPKTLAEFMEVTGVKEEPAILNLLVEGFNESQYSAASDEIGEYINDAWDDKTQAQFRLAVRNYSKISGDSIEDSVALIKPGVDKKWNADVAAKAAAAAQTTPTVTA